MNYLLDTNILIEIEDNNPNLIKQLEQIKISQEGKIFISIFSFSEFFYGIIRKNPKSKNPNRSRAAGLLKSRGIFTLENGSQQSGGVLDPFSLNKEKILERLKEYELVNTTRESAIIFCEILSQLKDLGRMIPQFDAFIAALAIENDLTLITADEHFQGVQGLKTILLKIK